jgi:hypothetical protein
MKEVICIKNHSKNVVVKDKIYTVYSILETSCNCGPKTLYDVGVINNSESKRVECPTCKKALAPSDIFWISSVLFADLADISELQEILTKELSNGVS